jgi:shikimate kinase
MNIVLIGYRGTGKTSVARVLSERLGKPWIDADVEIERQAEKSIAEIFADSGENAFRDLEAKVVAELAERDGWILALGGGAILREENRERIKKAGPAVWLTATPQTIHYRMTGDPTTADKRPNLTAAGGLAEIEHLLDLRTPIYEACADIRIDTEDKSLDQIADEAIQALDEGRGTRGE